MPGPAESWSLPNLTVSATDARPFGGFASRRFSLLHGEIPPMPTADDPLVLVARAEAAGLLSATAAANIRRWLTEPPFAAYRDRLIQDIEAGNWKVLDDAFYAVIEFGTGGRRGRMYPVGTNVLNDRTIGESARGLADFVIARKGPGASASCVVAHDTRHRSEAFARRCATVMAAAGLPVYLFRGPPAAPPPPRPRPEAFARRCATVMAAAGFRVYLFRGPRSTPLLSFAVRHLHCDAGIMITASHNPPADNGFKCYNEHGGQVIPPDDG